MRAFLSGQWRDVSSGDVRIGSEWRPLVRAEYFNGTEWKQIVSFVPPLSLSISPTIAGGSIPAAGLVTTNSVSAVPTGGQAPFTYLWEFVSGDASSVTTPTTAATTFSSTVAYLENRSATFRCTATDAIGQTATAEITATFASAGFDIGGGF